MGKKISCLFVAAAMLVSLWGCSSVSSSQSLPQGDSAAQSSSAPQSAFPVTITDAAGREVTIQQQPQALVSGYYITSSMLIALGQQDKLVGIEAKAENRPIYGLSAPELLKLPNVGTAKEFNLEGCAALKPDLVILPLKLKNSAADLEQLGITSLVVSPENQEQLANTLALLGAATGTAQRAEEILNFSKQKQSFLTTALADAEKPTVYLSGNSSYLSTAGAKMYQNTMIELAGGRNAAAELEDSYWSDVSYEQLLAWNPEVILIAPEASYSKQDILADAQLSGISAVQNNRVYQMPSSVEAWDSPIPGSIIGSLWTASILHSDRYSAADFQKDAVEFYQSFYSFEPTAEMLTTE